MARIESEDFEHWTQPEICFHPPVFQYYSMGVTPYEGIYIGTPWIVWEKSKDRTVHTPVISPGLGVSRDGWSWQQLFVGQALLPTGEPHSGDNRQIGMATLRLDGFVGIVAGKEPGRLLTRPFVLEGRDLYVNAACESHGEISIAMLDGDGKVLPGFGHTQCIPVHDDGIKQRAAWKENATLSAFRDRRVRLEFRIKDARIYSFWFQD